MGGRRAHRLRAARQRAVPPLHQPLTRRWPEPSYPGAESFPGLQLHARYDRTPDILAGRRALVRGIGNSACDIAESSRVARETYLAMRRGAHVVPQYLFGVPTDHLTDSVIARRPVKVQQLGMAAMLRIAQVRVTDYGLTAPDRRDHAAGRGAGGVGRRPGRRDRHAAGRRDDRKG